MDETEAAPTGAEKITLPSGGWIQVRDPKSYRSRDKKAIMCGVKGSADELGVAQFGIGLTDFLIETMITDWSLPYGEDWPIPRLSERDKDTGTPVVLDDLEIPDYDKIMDVANEVRALIFPGQVTPDDYDNPASPTPPAAE